MAKMKNYISKYRIILGGVILGAIGGYLYYLFVGCNSGTCAITSSPVNSTLYGAVVGGLIGNILKKPEQRTTLKNPLNKEKNN